jgi:hypothetical protein
MGVGMNERIEQLADQAGADIWGDQVMASRHFDIEKFAELIVRECANQCDLLLDHRISSEWSRGTHDCSRAIKKHFGVE